MNALAAQLYENGEIGIAGRPVMLGMQKAPANGGGVNYDTDYVYPGVGRLAYNALGMLGSLAGYKALEAIKFPRDSTRNALKGSFEKVFKQYYFFRAKNEFPFLSQRYGFLQGSSIVDRYCTITVKENGEEKEKPLLMLPRGADIKNVKEFGKQYLLTYYQNPGHSENYSDELNDRLKGIFFNHLWAQTGTDSRYMNGDLREMEEFSKFQAKLASIDVRNIHQLGKCEEISIAVPVQGGGTVNSTIRIYHKPYGLMTYLPNEGGNFLSDVVDRYLFKIVEAIAGSRIARQISEEEQLNAHVKLRANVTATLGGRKPLEHYT